MTISASCRSPFCRGVLAILIEVGELPVSNGYISPGQIAPRRPLTLCRCGECGLLQLAGTFSEKELAAQVPDWLRYNEPETHLDELAANLGSLMAADRARVVAGLTYIDQSLQDRLKKAGWEAQAAVDVLNGAPAETRCGIEQMLDGVQSGQWSSGSEKFDLLLARHVLDHARDTRAFLTFIKSCLSSRGLALFEVPNSVHDIEACNPLMLWESHANYFTPATFLHTLEAAGFSIVFYREFMSGGSAMLLAVCAAEGGGTVDTEDASDASIQAYAGRFYPNRNAVATKLSVLHSQYQTLAMLGAGHIGNLFLNLHGVNVSCLDCALDDDARKSGLVLPGSGLPIRPASSMAGAEDLFILMAVNPVLEERVIERLRHQVPSAVFGSIFPQSPRAVLKL